MKAEDMATTSIVMTGGKLMPSPFILHLFISVIVFFDLL